MKTMEISDQTTTALGTPSTTSEEKEKIIEKKVINPKFVLASNKRYKNLVHCYKCNFDDCQLIFKSHKELITHQKTHEKKYNCSVNGCNKSFKDKTNLKKHYKKHFPSIKKYLCPFEGCGKKFTASYNLNIHYRIHVGKKPYLCYNCGKRFYDRANYNYHLSARHVDINDKKLTCQHKNCNHKSKSIKQQLMHHDKLETYCVEEKNALFNLIMMFKASSSQLLNCEDPEKEIDKKINEDKSDNKAKNIIDDINYENMNFLTEIKYFDLDESLKTDLNNIILQSKKLLECAIDKDQYQNLIDIDYEN